MYKELINNYKYILAVMAFCAVLLAFRYIFSVSVIFFVPQYNLYNPAVKEKLTPSNFVKAFTPYTDISYIWSKWDTVYYLQIAQHGYDHAHFDKKQLRNWAFYPLYSYVVRMFSLPFLSNTIAVLWMGALLSNIAFLASVVYLRKLFSVLRIENTDSWGIIALLIAFPTSYFFSLFYPESLFLLLSAAYFYYLFQRNYFTASLLVGLAFVTKAQATSLFLPFYLYYFFKEILPIIRNWKLESKNLQLFLRLPLYLAIQLLPVAAFYYHLYDITGDFFAAWKIQTLWNADLYPFSLFVTYYKLYGFSIDMSHIFTLLFMISLICMFIAAVYKFGKQSFTHKAFHFSLFPEYLSLFAYAFSFIIVLSSISSFNSVFRYAGVNFVFFLLPVVFLGIKPKHILLFGSMMIISLLLQSFFFTLFLITIPAYGF